MKAHRKRKDRAFMEAQSGLLEAARVMADLLVRIEPDQVPLVMNAKLAELVAAALERKARDGSPAERDRVWSMRKAFLIKRINSSALAIID